ncbi:uncharacterized protein LOC109859149 isoform X2 [Pseudomyrmex gracilis]|uniref:uncharacterized protein LOC109859149 isoform X2 n=1 Tax=Pseudomyrmex gracilis TaxID=219809 RepID=UPI000994C85A|nr:uncharacterized protein LOC109859149 isoform X2 [Pseudomyrmex gracilis]
MMSETMMQDERTNIHYSVSSSAYYGFVPLTVRDNQQDSCNLPWRDCRLEALEEWNWQSNSRELGGGSRGQQLPREDFGRKCLKRTRDLASQERPLGLKRLRRGALTPVGLCLAHLRRVASIPSSWDLQVLTWTPNHRERGGENRTRYSALLYRAVSRLRNHLNYERTQLLRENKRTRKI